LRSLQETLERQPHSRQFVAILAELKCARWKRRCLHSPARVRVRCSRPARELAIAGRNQRTAASVQNHDQAAGGSVQTTSSSRDLHARTGTRASRQAEDANETLGILLVVMFAHGESGEVGTI